MPVLAPPNWLKEDPARLAVFANAENKLIPDPAIYSDWFAQTDERRRRIAVGSRRYSMLQAEHGDQLGYEHFVDPKTGSLLSLDRLKKEGKVRRAERVAKVRAVVQQRRELIRQAAVFGFAA